MRRLLQRFYYLTETLLIRSAVYQLLIVAMVIILLSVTGGLVVHFTNPAAYKDTLEAIWWAFLRLTDPGYLGDDQGAVPRLVSTVLTLAGYVVFLGALVAIMTAWLNQLMNFLASGRSPIFERDHVLIIGWNDRIHALVEEVVHTWRRVLDHDAKPAIAILCETFRPSMHRELLQKLDPTVRKNCRLLIRAGNPLEVESLERVDFLHARSVILVSSARGDRQQAQLSDMTLAKVLMTLKSRAPDLETPPNVVAEVSNSANKFLVESIGWSEHTESVVGEEILGQLFCQAVRFPGLSKVYRRLLTDSYGDSLTVVQARSVGAVGKPLRELIGSLPNGIPIGVLPLGGDQSALRLLDLETPVAEADCLVLVSSDAPPVHAGESGFAQASGWSATLTHPPVRRLLCVGWSTLVSAILSEVSTYREERFEVTLLWDADLAPEREKLQRFAEQHENLQLEFLQGTLADQDEVARFAPDRFDVALLLSDQRRDSLLGDAETVLHYVLLERYFRLKSLPVWFVVELNDEDNRPLITSLNADVIMSSEIISHLLAQVAIHRSLAWIYEELFTRGGSELRLRGLNTLGTDQELTFAQCQAAALAHRSVAVGIRRHDVVILNPKPDEPLRGEDKLISVEAE